MTSFFPDVNVWIALSDGAHVHHTAAWNWLGLLPSGTKLILSRFTQLGLLRLLTSNSVMGAKVLTLDLAWQAYQEWLDDPRTEFYPEPRGLDSVFREATAPFGSQQSSKWIGDCYLLAFAQGCGATLVTFDKALVTHARRQRHKVIEPKSD